MIVTVGKPQRRATDHVHPEYWTAADHHRYDEKLSREIASLEKEVKKLGDRVLMMLGALGLMAFLLPIIAPYIRSLMTGIGP